MGSTDQESDPFWGNRALLPDLQSMQCKGNLIAARRRYVDARWGVSMRERLAEGLPAREASALRSPPLPFTWHPIATLCALDEAIVNGAMKTMSHMRDFGEDIARADISVLYRAFFRLGSPEFALSKSRLIYAQYFRPGRLESTVQKGHADVWLREVVLPRYLCEFGISGFLYAGTEAAGGQQITSTHVSCTHRGDPECRWQIDWR